MTNDKTGPLAFIGGGEWTDGCQFDASLLEAARSREVLVLPTAAAYEHPERVVERASAWFENLDATVRPVPVLTRRDAEDPELAEMLARADFIYLSDGSPMHLRSVLKETAVFRALESAWRGGAVIACSSAAATTIGDPMVDPRGGTFTIGLGLVRGLAVVPEWDRWTGDRARRMNHLTPSNVAIAEIEERTALIRLGDGTWETAGVGRVSLTCNRQPLALADLESAIQTEPLQVPTV